MKNEPTYETERLLLRPTTVEDAPFILELMNSPAWIANIGDRGVRTVEDAEQYIQTKMRPQLEHLGYSNNTVIRKSDGAKMGSCGVYDREGLEGVDIGFSFLPDYWGKGYAYEAAHKMKELAFGEFGLSVINGITIEANLPSRRLLEKLGLKLIKMIQLPNDPEELMFYQIKK